MYSRHSSGEGESGIEFAWRDALLNVANVMIMIGLLLLFAVHEAKKGADPTRPQAKIPGNLIVEMVWDKDRDIDLDLWVQAPGDKPVGYSRKSGLYLDLVRDDLGKHNDLTDINEETVFSRGIPSGEYCVNVHAYRMDSLGPVQATIAVRINEGNKSVRELVLTKVMLKSNGEETTAFRFRLTQDGQLVKDSLNHIFKPLRAANDSNG